MFEEMMGTKPVSERQKFDVDALDAYLRAHVAGYPGGAAGGRAVQGRPVEPDLQARAPAASNTCCAPSPARPPSCCRRPTRSTANSA